MKRTLIRYSLIAFAIVLPMGHLIAQSTEEVVVRDLELWTGASLNYKPVKKLNLGLEQQVRLKDNVSKVDRYFSEINAEYSLLKPLKLGTEWRFLRINDTEGNIQGYENHLRRAFYVKYKHNIASFDFGYRLQYQRRSELNASNTTAQEPQDKWRLKLGVRYNIPKWKFDPRLSGEIFRNAGSTNDFSKLRGTLSTQYKTNVGNFNFFYRIEKELNVSYPQTTHIVGVRYGYTLKRKKK